MIIRLAYFQPLGTNQQITQEEHKKKKQQQQPNKNKNKKKRCFCWVTTILYNYGVMQAPLLINYKIKG